MLIVDERCHANMSKFRPTSGDVIVAAMRFSMLVSPYCLGYCNKRTSCIIIVTEPGATLDVPLLETHNNITGSWALTSVLADGQQAKR